MVTLKDISIKTGYSTTTVSKSLNNYDEIPKVTRDLIKQAAKDLGYIPNLSAKSLKTNKSWTIGVIYDEISGVGLRHPFFSKVLDSFRNTIELMGYDILFISKSSGGQKVSYYEHSIMKRVEAVFVLCAAYNSNETQEIFTSKIPSVVIDYIGESTTTITSGNENSIYNAIKHLKDNGHTKIAHLHGTDVSYVGRVRKKCYLDSMEKLGLEVKNEYLISGEFYSIGEGFYAMQQLLNLEDPPTAIFCASDTLAIGAIEACHENNIDVPNDISVIGFDGIDICQMFKPKLSTIEQDTLRIGSLAAEILKQKIEDKYENNESSIQYVESVFLKKDSSSMAKKN